MSAWSIALDSIWHHKLRSALTGLGIMIGVFAVVTLNALGAGVKNYINAQFSGAGADLITVMPSAPHAQGTSGGGGRGPGGRSAFTGSAPSTLSVADAQAIAGLAHVSGAAPVEQAPGVVQAGGATAAGASIIGTTAPYFHIVNLPFTAGSAPGLVTGAILGHKLAGTLFPGGNALGRTVMVAGTTYPVTGVLASSTSQLGAAANDAVYIPVAAALRIAGSTYVNEILVSVDQSQNVNAVTTAVNTLLAQRHPTHDFAAVTAGQILSEVNSTLSVVTDVLAGIAAISLVVGGIGIMNIMLVTVTERVKEIGTRKALGARDSDILVQFLVESVLLAVVGGAVGTGLSALAGRIVGHVIKFPIGLTVSAVTVALVFSVGVGVVFGVVPAMNAARLMPADALRSE